MRFQQRPADKSAARFDTPYLHRNGFREYDARWFLDRDLNERGIQSGTSWIIGYPGETPESVAETLDFIRTHHPSTVNLAVLRPYPSTEAYEIASASGDERSGATNSTAESA